MRTTTIHNCLENKLSDGVLTLTCRLHVDVSLGGGALALPSRRLALLFGGEQRGDLFRAHDYVVLACKGARVPSGGDGCRAGENARNTLVTPFFHTFL